MTQHPADPLDEERPCPVCGDIPFDVVCDSCSSTGTLPPRNPDAPKVLLVFKPFASWGWLWAATTGSKKWVLQSAVLAAAWIECGGKSDAE